jgi:hypothetical protein
MESTFLVPGNDGQDCPGNPECCDECDYLMHCTNFNGLLDNCSDETDAGPLNAVPPPSTPTPPPLIVLIPSTHSPPGPPAHPPPASL